MKKLAEDFPIITTLLLVVLMIFLIRTLDSAFNKGTRQIGGDCPPHMPYPVTEFGGKWTGDCSAEPVLS